MKQRLLICAMCITVACACSSPSNEQATADTTAVTTTEPPTTTSTTTTTTTAPPTTTTQPPRTTTTVRASRGEPRTQGSGVAILERIAKCESGGSYTAKNKRSTASGKYQVLDTTWNHYGGFRRAMDAPPAVQEAQARALYERRGTQPWNASKGCWG